MGVCRKVGPRSAKYEDVQCRCCERYFFYLGFLLLVRARARRREGCAELPSLHGHPSHNWELELRFDELRHVRPLAHGVVDLLDADDLNAAVQGTVTASHLGV